MNAKPWKTWAARSAVATLVVGLMGCATVQVHRIGTDSSTEAAFELEGASKSQLDVEARRLCPNGYHVMRQSQQYQRLDNDDIFYVRWWNRASALVSGPTTQKAQLTVVCKVVPPTP
ncbi:MAG: hypothetical protein KGL90_10295 [Burkholderiales bacterium]|nr:hypothetical protein [Burkholderiales bacterium]